MANDDLLMKMVEEEVARQERYERLITCMSADNARSKPTEKQHEVFKAINSESRYRLCLGGNQSSKTSIILRELTWVLEDRHPYWVRPIDHICNNRLCRNKDTIMYGDESAPKYRCPLCGNIWRPWDPEEPLHIILAGQNHKNLLLNLYEPRIKPLLTEPSLWKEVKIGSQYIGWIENRKTKDKLIFFPHGQGEEQVRKGLQGFTIHFVYFDELAPMSVLEELQRRVDAKLGYFTAAYSMKKTDPAVLRMQSGQLTSGAARMFKFSKLDNPVYAGDKERILAQLAGLPKEKIDAILYGDIEEVEDNVFSIDESQTKIAGIPEAYHIGWRHVEIVDPATKSTAGYTVIAQNPSSLCWFVVQSTYIRGMQDVLGLYDRILEQRNKIQGRNFVKFVSDSQHWFTSYARQHSCPTQYMIPPNKQSRIGGKVFLIKRLQTFISEGRLLIPKEFDDLWNEILSYRWKEGTKEEIVNSHRFHIIDTLMYFVDCLPQAERTQKIDLSLNDLTRILHRATVASKPGVASSPKHFGILSPRELSSRLRRTGVKVPRL